MQTFFFSDPPFSQLTAFPFSFLITKFTLLSPFPLPSFEGGREVHLNLYKKYWDHLQAQAFVLNLSGVLDWGMDMQHLAVQGPT